MMEKQPPWKCFWWQRTYLYWRRRQEAGALISAVAVSSNQDFYILFQLEVEMVDTCRFIFKNHNHTRDWIIDQSHWCDCVILMAQLPVTTEERTLNILSVKPVPGPVLPLPTDPVMGIWQSKSISPPVFILIIEIDSWKKYSGSSWSTAIGQKNTFFI